MKIGIIVYSQTGNTKSVAELLKEKLIAAGHNATIDPVVPAGEIKPGSKDASFTAKPNTDVYEGIILASPVQAFSLASAMNAYLPHLGPLGGKKIACLVTKQLKGAWTGANKALRTMKRAVEDKGGTVAGEDFIVWSSKERDTMIADTIEHLANLF